MSKASPTNAHEESWKTTPVRWSKFGHLLEGEQEICAYHALKIITIYIDRSLKPWLERIDGQSIESLTERVPTGSRGDWLRAAQALCEAAILVPVDYAEDRYLEQVQDLVPGVGHVRVLVLHLTGHCNLGCSYCFIDGGKIPGYAEIKMTPAVAAAAIDRFAFALRARPVPGTMAPASVVFYGGEPLLNLPALRSGLEHIESSKDRGELPRSLHKVLITNGTLIDREVAFLLKEHNVSVSVSLDGPQHIHDRHRRTHGGRGSFQKAIAGYQRLREVGICPSVACVISPESVDHVAEILQFFVEELGVQAVGMNHVSILPELGFDYDETYEKRFADAVIAGQELVLQYGTVYERRMSQKLNSFLDRRIVKADCTGCGEQVAVAPTGEISVCQGYVGHPDAHHVGHVMDENLDVNQAQAVKTWARRSPLTTAACHDCVALATCGGGCPRNAEKLHGSIWDRDTAFCHFSRRATEWMIWKKRQAILAAMPSVK